MIDLDDYISEEDMEVVGQELANFNSLLTQIIVLSAIVLLIGLAYWHRDKMLYILAGVALLAYGAMQFSANIYIGLLLIILGVYNFIKAAWDNR